MLLDGDKRFGDHRLSAGRATSQRMSWGFVDSGAAVHMIGGFNRRGFAEHFSFLNDLLARWDSVRRSLSPEMGKGQKCKPDDQNDLFHEKLSRRCHFIVIRNVLNTKGLRNNTSEIRRASKVSKAG